jgi:hypothetical protein
LPNSQAVGADKDARVAGSSSVTPARPSAANTRSPAFFKVRIVSGSRPPATTGRWNRLPADARTHLPLYRSTDASAKMTASAPAASAVRSTVPALPGSLTLASTATSPMRPEFRRSSGTSTKSQTASSPCGVMVCASSPITSPLTNCTSTPASAATSTRSACLA